MGRPKKREIRALRLESTGREGQERRETIKKKVDSDKKEKRIRGRKGKKEEEGKTKWREKVRPGDKY